MKTSGRSLVVFYGSQTGTAEEFAGRLAKEGIRYKMKGMVADPEECDMVYILYIYIYMFTKKKTKQWSESLFHLKKITFFLLKLLIWKYDYYKKSIYSK